MSELTPNRFFFCAEKLIEKYFNQTAQNWFLSYRDCGFTPKECLDILKSKPHGNTIVKWCIENEDKEEQGLYLNCFIGYKESIKVTDYNFFDLGNEKGFYQVSYNVKADIAFCTRHNLNNFTNLEKNRHGRRVFNNQYKLASVYKNELFCPIGSVYWPTVWMNVMMPVVSITNKKRHLWIHGNHQQEEMESFAKLIDGQVYVNHIRLQRLEKDAKVLIMNCFEETKRFPAVKLKHLADGQAYKKSPAKNRSFMRNIWIVLLTDKTIEETYSNVKEQKALKERFIEYNVQQYH